MKFLFIHLMEIWCACVCECVCASDTIIASIVGLLVRQSHTNWVCVCVLAFASTNETTLFDFKALLSWKVHCTSLLYWSDKHGQTERDREEKRRSQKRKMENGITAKERWREMTHLLSIHPFTVRMNNYRTHSSLFTIDALAFVTCVAHTHNSHFIFVMCNDVPTFYMWTRKGIEVCGLDQFTHWLQLHTHTHTQIHQYVCTHQMFGWMSWDQIPSWSISTLRWCWQYDGALALARRLASVAFSLHIIQFLVWIEIISMCSTSSTLFQHALHQWDALSPYSVCLKYRYCACHCCCCYDAKLLIISFHLISCLIIYTCTVPVQKKTNVCIEIWYALQCIAS